ncbi:spore germination protein [Paenibacillus motobuensis]|uniref:spore germination protein n=1 Tax=Paenibacillus TaxID=44249 RepID=UPI00203E727F|nr:MULTISPECIES: spore germination protein [Paenibacillus]MCM3039161.1 spore germination protein [Paenibacillus lutimineralis]MCM3646265.1 spore germination protein [Paenibacillus motobuensis]
MWPWGRKRRVHDRNPKSSTSKSGQPPRTELPALETTDKRLKPRLDWFKQQFNNCSDVIFREFELSSGEGCAIIYLNGMIDQNSLQHFILHDLLTDASDSSNVYKTLFERRSLSVSHYTITSDLNECLTHILSSCASLLIDGDNRMINFEVASYTTRSIEETPNESIIRGSRESFIEDLPTNLTMLRRHLKTSALKTENIIIGKKTQTKLIISYIEGVCKPELVEEVKRRLSYIEIDGIVGTFYIEEFLKDNPYSPFPQIEYTERPDTVTASLLEGRIAIMMNGTPVCLVAPVTLSMLMQSPDDYNMWFIAGSLIRLIRYFFFFVSLLLPSLYIAITTFHPQMIPFPLLVTIASSREIVPFPVIYEAFMMEIAFEALREASIRIPKSIGQAVSIIGALIIGTAAVQAGIVSAAMVIIVSLTGIASFIIPHYDLGIAIRVLRFPTMILASLFGLYGIACALIFIYIHLVNLKSFGIPYLSPLTPFIEKDQSDTLIRGPWTSMRTRSPLTSNNRHRVSKNARGWAKPKGENE